MSSLDLLDQKILSRLEKQVEHKKWATSYLFTGKELERKKKLAVAFAKALNCTGKSNASNCNCDACRKIEGGNYPDVKWFGQDEEANSIKIGEVREFKNWLHLKPYEGRVKVFIFNQAERLTAEAQNALLKSAEEPPVGNVIIFLVPHAESLFNTIRSRCVEIKIPPFSSARIKEILVKDGINEWEADFLSRMCQGELSRAREAHEAGWFEQKKSWLEQLSRDPVSFLEPFQGASRPETKALFDFLTEWLRDLIVLRTTGNPEHLIHVDQAGLLDSVARRNDFDALMDAFESVDRIKKSLDDYANQKLALTFTAVALTHLKRS